MFIINLIKKTVQMTGLGLIITLACNTAARADENTPILKLIEQNTKSILANVQQLPTYIANMTTNIKNNLLIADTPSNNQGGGPSVITISNFQGYFATLGASLSQSLMLQNDNQQELLALFAAQLNVGAGDLSNPPNNPKILTNFPNVNDVAYQTMLGVPPIPKGPASPLNYVKNAAGLNVLHPMPGMTWGGDRDSQLKYINYYNTLMAVESFNGYALDKMMNDRKINNSTQSSLITQATGSDWFANIASEEIGRVLRQMLMFQSQMYVLLTQLVSTQKDLLTAQVMTNSLLILNMNTTESLLIAKAQGTPPKP